jgi:hypothetical protein
LGESIFSALFCGCRSDFVQISRGTYWYKPIRIDLEIVGNRFRYNYGGSPEPGSWVSISKLCHVNKGVVIDPTFRAGDSAPYGCLSTLQKIIMNTVPRMVGKKMQRLHQ